MLSFPLRTEGGALATAAGPEAVMEKIALLIGTPAGARSLVPEYGCPDVPVLQEDVPAFVQDLRATIELFIPDARHVQVSGALEDSTLRVSVAFEWLREEVRRDFFIGIN